MSRFVVHWSQIDPSLAPHLARPGEILLALWPAPVNPDACFEEAGFEDFADHDDLWDERASALLARVVDHLAAVCGEAQMVSPPLTRPLPWYRRRFRPAPAYPLLEQLELPMRWDSLPRCAVRFGASGAALRTGDGHFLLWIALPVSLPETPEALVQAVASPFPVVQTALHWERLIGAP